MINKHLYQVLSDDKKKLLLLKRLGVVDKSKPYLPTLYYNGVYTDCPIECSLIGYVDDNEVVISVNGKPHSIHPDYLKEMQKSNTYSEVINNSQMSFGF